MASSPGKRMWTDRVRGGTLAVLAALLALPLALPSRAAAAPSVPDVAVGLANLHGTDAERSFIGGGPGYEGDVALDARHVYWTRSGGADGTMSAIGRAELDGSGTDRSFVAGLPGLLTGLAVDAEHVYWTWNVWTYDPAGWPRVTRGIGRANLDGTGVEQSFVGVAPGDSGIGGIAVDAGHLYWTVQDGIGRANLDGTGVEPRFVPTHLQTPLGGGGLAIDAEHLYWVGRHCDEPSICGKAIGRANLDGGDVREKFIAGPVQTLHPDHWSDVAVDAGHIYWTAYGYFLDGWINSANLDGTGTAPLNSTGEAPGGVAVDGRHIYWAHRDDDNRLDGTATASKAQRQTGDRILVKVRVKAKERLTVKAGGEIRVNPTYKLKRKTAELATGETTTLRLRPKRPAARRIAAALKQGEHAEAKITVGLSDPVGNTETEKLRVKLKR